MTLLIRGAVCCDIHHGYSCFHLALSPLSSIVQESPGRRDKRLAVHLVRLLVFANTFENGCPCFHVVLFLDAACVRRRKILSRLDYLFPPACFGPFRSPSLGRAPKERIVAMVKGGSGFVRVEYMRLKSSETRIQMTWVRLLVAVDWSTSCLDFGVLDVSVSFPLNNIQCTCRTPCSKKLLDTSMTTKQTLLSSTSPYPIQLSSLQVTVIYPSFTRSSAHLSTAPRRFTHTNCAPFGLLAEPFDLS
jgi:hypothetical protein